MWKSGTFKEFRLNSPIVQRFINTFNKEFDNGGTIIHCFQVTNHQVFRELPWKEEKYETYFNKLLSSPDIRNNITELNINDPLETEIGLKEMNSLILDGDFAITLMWGGAYSESDRDASEAKKLGQMMCDYMFQDRYSEVKVFHSAQAWTDWFHGIAWDSTWLIFDETELKLWLICMTDED